MTVDAGYDCKWVEQVKSMIHSKESHPSGEDPMGFQQIPEIRR
jgi:hypothetical protein